MRQLFPVAFALAVIMSVSGCDKAPAPVAETEDQFEAYDRMIAEDQAQTEQDSEEQ